MTIIKRLVIVEAIIFLAAAVITFVLGEMSIERYGSILLYCGFGALVLGVAVEFGSKRGAMSDRWSAVRTSHQQQMRDMKDMQSSGKTTLYFFAIGAVPIVVGYLIIFLS